MGGNGTTNQNSHRARTSKKKRERGRDNNCDSSAPPIEITPGRSPCGGEETGTGTADEVSSVEVPLFWDSPEAAKLFGFSYENGDDEHRDCRGRRDRRRDGG